MKLFLLISAKKIETVIFYSDNYLWKVGIQKKVRFFFFPSVYKCLILCGLGLSLLLIFTNIYDGDMSDFIKYSLILDNMK